jgi:hypothetical protein
MHGSSGTHRYAASGVLVALLLVGCGSATTSPSAPATAVASAATPPAAERTESALTPAPASVGSSASPAASSPSGSRASPGAVSIVGSNEIHEQQTQTGGTEKYDMVSHFSATAGAGNAMSGTAELTGDYSVDSGCSWATGPLAWTATLDGTYELRPDGSLFLNLLATPATSQTVTLDFGCGAVAAPAPYSIPWPGAYGLTLQNGLLDTSNYTPAAAPEVGGETITWHIEQTAKTATPPH